MTCYGPGPAANLQAWHSNIVTYANADLAALGLAAKQTKDEARAA